MKLSMSSWRSLSLSLSLLSWPDRNWLSGHSTSVTSWWGGWGQSWSSSLASTGTWPGPGQPACTAGRRISTWTAASAVLGGQRGSGIGAALPAASLFAGGASVWTAISAVNGAPAAACSAVQAWALASARLARRRRREGLAGLWVEYCGYLSSMVFRWEASIKLSNFGVTHDILEQSPGHLRHNFNKNE